MTTRIMRRSISMPISAPDTTDQSVPTAFDTLTFRQSTAPRSAIETVADDIADAIALVRLAIVAMQQIEETQGRPDPETVGAVTTSLFVVDRDLCRLRDRCEVLGR